MTSTCRSCGAEILWASTLSGALAPFDAELDPDGTWILEAGMGGSYVARNAQPDDVRAGRDRRTSHFATCPDADSWRHR